MNLLISQDGVVLGQTLSPENALRHVMVSRMPLYVVTEQQDFSKLPKPCVRALNEDYGAKSFRALWAMVTHKAHPYWGKVSVKKVLRHMYSDHKCQMTRDQLLKAVPGATWISITTAFSMLKNKAYAGGSIIIVEQIDGKYRRTN